MKGEIKIDYLLLSFPFLVVLSALMIKILSHPKFISMDPAMYLSCAQLILAGKLPYVDFVDILPPFVFYFFVPPMWISRAVGIEPTLAVLLLTWLLIAYSLVFSLIVLWKKLETRDLCLALPMLFGFCLLNFPLFFHFAQKEHIFVLTLMPFFLLRWLRLKGYNVNNWFSATIGAIVGTGICLKPPQFLFVVAALEIYWLLQSKKQAEEQFVQTLNTKAGLTRLLTIPGRLAMLVAPEMVSCVAVLSVYFAWFMLIAPAEMREAFLIRWMPLTVSGYGAFFCRSRELFSFKFVDGSMLISCWTVLIVCFIAVFLRKSSSLLMPLLVWTIAGYVVYVVQQKGWAYHTIIVLAGYFLLAVLELAILARWFSERKWIAANILRGAVTPIVLTFMFYSPMLSLAEPALVYDSFASGHEGNRVEEIVHRNSHPGDGILILSPSPELAYPCLIHTGNVPGSRYLWTYPIEMCEYLQYHAVDPLHKIGYQEEERRIVSELSEDVKKNHPQLIIMEAPWRSWSYPGKIFSYCRLRGFNSVLEGYVPFERWNRCLVWCRSGDQANQ